MRFNRRRRGGTIFNTILLGSVLFLVVSVAWYTIQEHAKRLGVGGNTSTTTTGSITNGTSSSTTNSTATTNTAKQDNMSLAQLQTLTFANTTKCDGVLHQKFWDNAIQSSGKTIVTIIPNTAYGLTGSYNGWTQDFQNATNATALWLPGGLENYATNFVTSFAARVIGTHDATQAAGMLRNFTNSVSGLRATAADFLAFGGLSGIKVYGETGNITQAAEATFPGQIYQLFTLSQDCSYSEEQRGQFFGTAMAMSLFILATSGKDGFGPKFDALLVKLGLRDAWAGMKASVKEIMDTSPAAAYQTVMVLSALAKKFPNAKMADLASFTSGRIANMVKVLKDQGFSPDDIAQKVADLNQAVDESDDEGHVADVADAVSYQLQGFIRMKISSNLGAVLYSGGHAHPITASFLALILPGFRAGEATALKVTVHKLWMELPSYEFYRGGKSVEFELPKQEVAPGDEVGLSFEVLPVEDFASSAGQVLLLGKMRWGSDGALLEDFKVVDGILQFRVLQNNRWSSVQDFTIQGQVVKYPGVSNQYGGIYAEFAIKDYAGRLTNLRLRYDGFTFQGAALQLVEKDGNVRSISVISFDGFRLSIVYRENYVATTYLEPPSESVYSLSTKHPYSGPYLDLVHGRYTNAWQIDSVVMPRDLENAMLKDGSSYDLGRLGAEISYVAGDKLLGLKNLIIQEPAVGGRDLYTLDNTLAIQARFLKNFKGDPQTGIQQALFDLAEKLQQDYENQPKMQDGYAILSYVDIDGTVKTIILEVPRW